MKKPPKTFSHACKPPSGGGGIAESVVTAAERGLSSLSPSLCSSCSCFSRSCSWFLCDDADLEIACSSVEVDFRSVVFSSLWRIEGDISIFVRLAYRMRRSSSSCSSQSEKSFESCTVESREWLNLPRNGCVTCVTLRFKW
jgi:hypothetical protein